MNMPGTFDSSFRYHWPTLGGQSHYSSNPQSMHQHPMQMPHALAQPEIMMPAANTAMSHFTPDQLRAFEVSQSVPETMNYSLEGNDIEMDHVGHTHGFLAQQGIEILGHGPGKTPLPPDGINSDDVDTGSNRRAEYDLTYFARAGDASVLEDTTGFDGEFNFDFEAFPTTGGKNSEIIDTEVEARDLSDTLDVSEECELARLLAPVAEYLSFRGNDHSENSAEEVATDGIPETDGTDLGSTHDVISQSNRNDYLQFPAKLQSPIDLDAYSEDAINRLPIEPVSINRFDQNYTRKESLQEHYTFHEDPSKESSLSTTPNASNGTSASGQATASTQTSMSSSPADLSRAKSSWPIGRTASDTILSRTSAIGSSASENLQTTFQGARHGHGKNTEEITERVQGFAGHDYDRLAEKRDAVRSDMTDWVNDRFPADEHQLIATKFKMPRISPQLRSRVGIYGRQRIWGSGLSQLGEGQRRQ